MNFLLDLLKQNILLPILLILPIIKNILFWSYILQLKDYRKDRFLDYIKTPEGKKIFFSFLFVLEFIAMIIFILSIMTLDKAKIYGVTIFFVLENIFIIQKIISKKLIIPKFTKRQIIILILTILFNILVVFTNYFFSRYFILDYSVYFILYFSFLVLVSFSYFFIIISIILTLPLINRAKNKIFENAKMKSEALNEIIKVGITGSFGKSTMKNFLFDVFSTKFSAFKTPNNINTNLGVAKTILSDLHDGYKYFFCEMGAYKIGEISEIGNILEHKYGFLTGINNQHLSLFGSLENIKKGKSEIAEKILENNGVLYLNYDNSNIKDLTFDKNLQISTYGLKNKNADVVATIKEVKRSKTEFYLDYKGRVYTFITNIIGEQNILNLTGIISFAFDQGIDEKSIKKSVLNLTLPKHTLEVSEHSKKRTFIDDTYNSNTSGVIAAVDLLKNYDKKKILILDDILELGNKSKEDHFLLGEKISTMRLDKIFLVGKNYNKYIKKGLEKGSFNKKSIFSGKFKIKKLKKLAHNDCVVLFEGRNSKKMLDILIK